MPPARISSLASSVGPSSTSRVSPAVWLEIVIVASPAPIVAGLTVTPSSPILALSSTGEGGRGLFSKSSSPQATRASAATSAAVDTISLLCTLIVRATLDD